MMPVYDEKVSAVANVESLVKLMLRTWFADAVNRAPPSGTLESCDTDEMIISDMTGSWDTTTPSKSNVTVNEKEFELAPVSRNTGLRKATYSPAGRTTDPADSVNPNPELWVIDPMEIVYVPVDAEKVWDAKAWIKDIFVVELTLKFEII